ncbi:hypothetical protein [Stenotrophomonas rhizophila]|uniref:hypothetical protein n=1 Tax=Stenotrophomonas rhizophila TaxID=216778 RepID=UPI00339778EB
MAHFVIYRDRDNFQLNGLDEFAITAQTRPEATCLRVLCGTCEISNSENDEVTIVATNFLESAASENSTLDLSFLDTYQEGITAQDYNEHLKGASESNRIFYDDFLSEITVAACAAENGQGISSFLHIYRAYERISYAFPLIYASKSRDYIGSFDNLKKWLADSKSDGSAGELAFFKKFIDATYEDDEKEATTDFHFLGSDETRRRQFALIRNQILKWRPEDVTPSTIDNQVISVRFDQLHTILLTSRNRYFHQMSGRSDNIKQAAVVDPETFFLVLCRPLLTYVAKLFHDIVIEDMKTPT